MRAAGDVAVNLGKKSAKYEAACMDLLMELAELEKLVDPKSLTAGALYRFDKNPTRNPTGVQDDHRFNDNSNDLNEEQRAKYELNLLV
ncbi:hypothetical protein F5Y09DRAFT_345245 [Xylaria sp. FL1042]|nr:hypothetical protein F5Y09DRAFT_345245 [Xylaria sp. FL1042]